jgi:hypothetical protein
VLTASASGLPSRGHSSILFSSGTLA